MSSQVGEKQFTKAFELFLSQRFPEFLTQIIFCTADMSTNCSQEGCLCSVIGRYIKMKSIYTITMNFSLCYSSYLDLMLLHNKLLQIQYITQQK